MTDDNLKAEVLRYTLEQIAKDPTTSIMFDRELNELLATLTPDPIPANGEQTRRCPQRPPRSNAPSPEIPALHTH